MNTRKTTVTAICLSLSCSLQLFGQGITTLICQGNQTNSIQITAQQSVQIKSYWDSLLVNHASNPSAVNIQSGTTTISLPASSLIRNTTPGNNIYANYYTPDLMIAGPATVSLATTSYKNGITELSQAILTLDVEPVPFPPGKTLTLGANSGNAQVTMETSTDLVNWTSAVNGQLYTNSPTARFFRINLQINAGP